MHRRSSRCLTQAHADLCGRMGLENIGLDGMAPSYDLQRKRGCCKHGRQRGENALWLEWGRLPARRTNRSR